jgi:hypothetical protein
MTALYVRSGGSNNRRDTAIAQMMRFYKDPSYFPRHGSSPWKVVFTVEHGIVAECPADL